MICIEPTHLYYRITIEQDTIEYFSNRTRNSLSSPLLFLYFDGK